MLASKAWRVLCMACALTACATQPVTPGAPTTGDGLAHLPSLRGDYFAMHSRATGRVYHLYVRLPEGYDPNAAQRYPAVYLLDGDSLFPLLAPTHLFLHYDEQLPEAVIVGIAYGGFSKDVNFRDIDFNPAIGQAADARHGAEAFQRFLAGELLPEIESRFAIDPSRRVLLGQSRGGTFVLWNAQQAPDLFWARIASNPGAGSGEPAFRRGVVTTSSRDLRVVVASGTRDTPARREAARVWTQAWSSDAVAPWKVELLTLENGTHAASIGEVYRRAMLKLFAEDIAKEAGAR